MKLGVGRIYYEPLDIKIVNVKQWRVMHYAAWCREYWALINKKESFVSSQQAISVSWS
jgi:hypothetical protein